MADAERPGANAPKNLRQKLVAVMGDTARIPKRGRNEFHKYDYVMAADVNDEVCRSLVKYGIAFISDEEQLDFPDVEKGNCCRARMKYTFMDTESDERLEVRSTGMGIDTGEKAIYKAKTGALKYALIQTLLIATGEDPEDDKGGKEEHVLKIAREKKAVAPKPDKPCITEEQIKEISDLVVENSSDPEQTIEHIAKQYANGDNTLKTMPAEHYEPLMTALRKRAGKKGVCGMILDLKQRTDDWLIWRKRRITGSMAPIILYASSFQSPYQLWLEMTGRTQPKEYDSYWEDGELVAPAVHHGIEYEDEARNAYSASTGHLAPPVCVQRDDLGYPVGASLDGLIDGKIVLEVKCPKDIRTHLMAREGQIPEEYYLQMQHQMLAAEADSGIYYSYFKADKKTPGEGVAIPVQVNPAVCEELIEAEKEFWSYIESDTYPLPKGEQDRRDDPALDNKLTDLLYAQRQLEIAETLHRQAKRALLRETRHTKKTLLDGATVSWVHRQGYVQYKTLPGVAEIVESLGNSIDKYRSAPSLYMRVTRTK